jgi:hypothetical protein
MGVYFAQEQQGLAIVGPLFQPELQTLAGALQMMESMVASGQRFEDVDGIRMTLLDQCQEPFFVRPRIIAFDFQQRPFELNAFWVAPASGALIQVLLRAIIVAGPARGSGSQELAFHATRPLLQPGLKMCKCLTVIRTLQSPLGLRAVLPGRGVTAGNYAEQHQQR